MSEEITESKDSKTSAALVILDGEPVYPEVAAYFNAQQTALYSKEDADADANHTWENTERHARREWLKLPLDTRRPRDYFDSGSWARHNPEFHVKYEAYRSAIRKNQEDYREALTAAREHLKTSPHLPVRWIEANALDSEEGYSHIILKVLPVKDPTELWDVKHKHGMCGEFDRLYARAEADGVFNGGIQVPGSRELVAFRNKIGRDYGARYQREIIAALAPYIKAVKDAHAEEIVQLKAEWQGLDEAWRSERSRRGAATRAANREAQDTEAEAASAAEIEEISQTAKAVVEEDQADPFQDAPVGGSVPVDSNAERTYVINGVRVLTEPVGVDF